MQLGPAPPHPHQRSELGRRPQEHCTHICPPHFQRGLSGAAPSPAPCLTPMAEPRDSAGPSGQSRQECALGPEPAGTGAGLQAAEDRGPISLPTSYRTSCPTSADPRPIPLSRSCGKDSSHRAWGGHWFIVRQKRALPLPWKSSLISALGPRTRSCCKYPGVERPRQGQGFALDRRPRVERLQQRPGRAQHSRACQAWS